MMINFENLAELSDKILSQEVTFEDDGQRVLINALAAYCAEYQEATLRNFTSSSGAWDVDDYLTETFFYSDWEVDWFDVITCSLDSRELAYHLDSVSSLRSEYGLNGLEGFVNTYLGQWARNTRIFLAKTLEEIAR